ncbi:MAG: UDP-galactopyranose mutase [Clostridiales bacterium]|nr:UDP-galactopyranose mutase [Clostridiales bacterium]
MYDYLIVGAGVYGSVFAHTAHKAGKSVLVVDKRPHIAGNAYTEEIDDIHVHKYGAHIFHTDSDTVWTFLNQFCTFNRFTNCPIANYHGKLYPLPFNMHTFYNLWGISDPSRVREKIEQQRRSAGITTPQNLEEQAIFLIGTELYETLVKGYTEKQWGRPCRELPASIINRLPVRLTFDNNYFDSRYQGIPIGGYTRLFERMLEGIEIRLNTDYIVNRSELKGIARKTVFTGPIDEYFDYCYGALEYRSVRFETESLDIPNFQGNAVINYTDRETPWTRIIEHKWFDYHSQPKTVISKEYSSRWQPGSEPFYPINDEKNSALYHRYLELAGRETNVIFGGRLGQYTYCGMNTAITDSLKRSKKELL